MDISKVMSKYYANSQWKCGETYASLVMLDNSAKPTESDLNTKWADYLATRRKNKNPTSVVSEVKTWLGTATENQKNELLALVATLLMENPEKLEQLKTLTSVDPTELDN